MHCSETAPYSAYMNSSAIPANIGQTSGPMVIGFGLQWCLFGALTVQLIIYHLAFPNDMRWIKLLVYGVYSAEVAQTVMLGIQGVEIYGSGYGNTAMLSRTYLLWFAVPVMSSTIAVAVQGTYAYRLFLLSQSRVVPGLIVLLSLTQWGGGIATGILAAKLPNLTRFLYHGTFISLGIWNAGAALCDVLIACFMTYYLSRDRSQWKTTRRIVQRLIVLVIETGTVTAALAIGNLILCLLPSRGTYYEVPSALLAKSYSNTLLSVFNSRIKLSGEIYNSSHNDQGLSSAFGELHARVDSTVSRKSILNMTSDAMKRNEIPLDTWTSLKGVRITTESHSDV